MKLKPTTRQFLGSALLTGAGLALAFVAVWFRTRAQVGGGPDDLFGFLVMGGLLILIFAIGVLVAWLRLLEQRHERSRRRPPLDL